MPNIGKCAADDPNQCTRCLGVGYTEVDRMPGVPHCSCCQCDGTGVKPLYMRSPAAYELEMRRQMSISGFHVGIQDMMVEMLTKLLIHTGRQSDE